MKILFVYPNIQRGARTPQLGICSLSAVLKLHGHECDLYDTTLVESGQEQTTFVQKLEDFQPHLVAFSIRSNEVRMVRLLKELIPEGITVVAGGYHATVATQEMMETFDIAVQGEGEYALLELVEKLEKGESLKDVQNVWVRENGVVHKNSLRALVDLDDLPFPDWQIFDEEHFTSHYLKGGVARGANIVGTFEGSRGCIFTCTYCSSPHLMNMYGGRSWRREKSPERMAEEVHTLKKLLGRLDYIYFVDEIFLTQRPRLERFRDIFSSQVNIPFTFMERPELITEEKMKLISEAGLRSFNREMPEERNRVIVDHCSDLFFCPTKTAIKHLAREGISQEVHLVGDTMYDSVLSFGDVARQSSKILEKLALKPGSYLLATVHRAYNTDSPEALCSILTAFSEIKETIVFPIHPRTKHSLSGLDGAPDLSQMTHVQSIKPVSYLDMLMLEQNARVILTDSGGVQKEAYFFGVPCITLRPETEWTETVESSLV